MPPHLDSDEALSLFLESFEAGTLPRTQWTHAAHVTVAASHLLELSPEEALPLIRAKIRYYNNCQGIANTPASGYHETLTCFWTAIVHACLKQCGSPSSRLENIRFVVNDLGHRRDLHRDYYSFDSTSTLCGGKWLQLNDSTRSDGLD